MLNWNSAICGALGPVVDKFRCVLTLEQSEGGNIHEICVFLKSDILEACLTATATSPEGVPGQTLRV